MATSILASNSEQDPQLRETAELAKRLGFQLLDRRHLEGEYTVYDREVMLVEDESLDELQDWLKKHGPARAYNEALGCLYGIEAIRELVRDEVQDGTDSLCAIVGSLLRETRRAQDLLSHCEQFVGYK